LVAAGGTPHLDRMAALCEKHRDAPECAFIVRRQGDQLRPPPATPDWSHDSRIRAIVVVRAEGRSLCFFATMQRRVGEAGAHHLPRPAGVDRAAVHRLVNESVVTFFEAMLR
jgi:hypothetical protein